MGIIKAVCTSAQKGTPKKDAGCGFLAVSHGIKGDAHAGEGHRQVSLLSLQKINDFRALGANVDFGDFGENLVVDGIDLSALPVGTRLICKDALLEITQIGKECQKPCAVFHRMGDCIMPREGVFARVLKGGYIKNGDEINAQ